MIACTRPDGTGELRQRFALHAVPRAPARRLITSATLANFVQKLVRLLGTCGGLCIWAEPSSGVGANNSADVRAALVIPVMSISIDALPFIAPLLASPANDRTMALIGAGSTSDRAISTPPSGISGPRGPGPWNGGDQIVGDS